MPLRDIIPAMYVGRGGRLVTEEQIGRERSVAEALMKQGADFSPAKGGWLEVAGRGLQGVMGGYKASQADAAAGKNAEFNQSLAGKIASSLMGSSSTTPTSAFGAPPNPGVPTVGTDPASSRVSNAFAAQGAGATSSDTAAYIKAGLEQRGLPSHVADAFIMNFQDESGLKSGINEKNPTVAGSRGGYGLYQLTGPRRREYEAYAAKRGVDPSDTDAQLDFMMGELQGSESKAFQSIMAAPDTGSAAAAIVNKFLRPAESHRASREARYLKAGGPPTPAASAIDKIAPPSQEPLSGVMSAQTSVPEQSPAAQAIAAAIGPTSAPPTPAGQSIMNSLTRNNVDPDYPMAGASSNLRAAGGAGFPAAPTAGGQMGGVNPDIVAALTDPRANDTTRSIATMLLKQQMDQQQAQQALAAKQADPMYQMQLQKGQLELDAARNPKPATRPMTIEERQQWGIPQGDQRPFAMTAEGPKLIGGGGQTINVGSETDARKTAAEQMGLTPDDPRYQSYVLTGKFPREDAQALTATDKKAILEADEMVSGAEGTLPLLTRALELNKDAYSGTGAGMRGWLTGNMGFDGGEATMEFDNIIQQQALGQLRAVFGGNPTEGERKIMLDIAGSSSMPADVRKGVLERAQEAVNRRLQLYRSRASELRGGTFYKNDDQQAGQTPQTAPGGGNGGWQDIGGVKIRKKQ